MKISKTEDVSMQQRGSFYTEKIWVHGLQRHVLKFMKSTSWEDFLIMLQKKLPDQSSIIAIIFELTISPEKTIFIEIRNEDEWILAKRREKWKEFVIYRNDEKLMIESQVFNVDKLTSEIRDQTRTNKYKSVMAENKKKAFENVKKVGSVMYSRDELYKKFCEAEKNHSGLRDVIDAVRTSATHVISEADLEWVRNERVATALAFAVNAHKSGTDTSALFDKCPERFHFEAIEKVKDLIRKKKFTLS